MLWQEWEAWIPGWVGGAAIYEVRGQAISAASEKAVIKLFAYQSVSNVLLTCCQDHYFGMSEPFQGKQLPVLSLWLPLLLLEDSGDFPSPLKPLAFFFSFLFFFSAGVAPVPNHGVGKTPEQGRWGQESSSWHHGKRSLSWLQGMEANPVSSPSQGWGGPLPQVRARRGWPHGGRRLCLHLVPFVRTPRCPCPVELFAKQRVRTEPIGFKGAIGFFNRACDLPCNLQCICG